MTAILIDHINIRSSEQLMPVLRDFYCQLLDLQVGHRPAFNSRGFWLYAGSQPLIHLSLCRPGEQRSTDQTTTLDHVAFRCSGYDRTLARLQEMGLTTERDVVPGQPIRQIFLTDPAGNGVELLFQAE